MGKAFAFVGQLAILALISFGLHFLIQSITKDLTFWHTAYMQLWQIYALQFLMSVVVILAVVGIGKVMPESLGYVFLGFFTLKVIVTYLIVRPMLDTPLESDFFKYNYFGVFFLFMVFDVYVTYRVLNQIYSPKNN